MSTHDAHRRGAGDGSGADRVTTLLSESGIDAGPGDPLVSALLELAALGTAEPVSPSAELAGLLHPSAPPSPAGGRRRPFSRRAKLGLATVTAAVCLSGLGVGAAAAVNPGFRHGLGHTITTIVGAVAGARHAPPAPPAPEPTAAAIATPTPSGPSFPAPTPAPPDPGGSMGAPQGHGSTQPSGTPMTPGGIPADGARRPTPVAAQPSTTPTQGGSHPGEASTPPHSMASAPTSAPHAVTPTSAGTHP